MSRLRISRPARDAIEPVLVRLAESQPADPGTADPGTTDPDPIDPRAGHLRAPRVVPAWLVAAALLLACAASVAAALWWQHRSLVIEVTNRLQPYYSAGPDAAGCPILSRCLVSTDLSQPLAVAARRLFPDATVLSSLTVVESGSGRTVQTTIVLHAPSGLGVSVTAQCVPGAGPISDRAASLPVAGPAQADFVVAGAPGCSVAVAAQIPRTVPVPLAELRQLARDPQVQLDP